MPIAGISQPEIIAVDDTLRLRRFDGKYEFALGWYQDAETVRLVDGQAKPYDMQRLGQMYRYLDAHGELYFIEVFRHGAFVPVGDVTFWQYDCPIVIGEPQLRGCGIGRRILAACRTMPPASRCSMSSRRSAPAASRITPRVTPRP